VDELTTFVRHVLAGADDAQEATVTPDPRAGVTLVFRGRPREELPALAVYGGGVFKGFHREQVEEALAYYRQLCAGAG
jgi:hypothetical protein